MNDLNFDDRLAQAVQLRTKGQYDEARRILNELLTDAPDSALIHYHLAWTHDAMGEESAAVPYYERALQLGLAGDDLRGALLGLGSTYRTLGDYERAAERLQQGLATFEDGHEFAVFLAMALYNLGEHQRAMELLLRTVAETAGDPHLQRYRRAILFYADKLDQTWS